MIRILSCNLFRGQADPAALAEAIERHAIDIVCAQELTDDLAERLAALLPHGDVAQEHRLRGNGIACRLPVETRRIPMWRRSGCVARLSPADWPGLSSSIEILNVHIAAPHYWPYFPNRVRRRAQLETLLADRNQAGDLPHAILGDFNASPAWPVYRRVAARYRDAALTAGDVAGAGSTWPRLGWLGLRGLLRIDHCFLHRLHATKVRRLDIPGSDHLGLLVDLGDST